MLARWSRRLLKRCLQTHRGVYDHSSDFVLIDKPQDMVDLEWCGESPMLTEPCLSMSGPFQGVVIQEIPPSKA